MDDAEEFPDDLLLDEAAPDPLARAETRSEGKSRSTVYWTWRKHRGKMIAGTAAAGSMMVLGLVALAVSHLFSDLQSELQSPPQSAPISGPVSKQSTPDFAPRFPVGPVAFVLDAQNVQFEQEDSVRIDLTKLVHDRLLDQSFTITGSSAYRIRLCYREVPNRAIRVTYKDARGNQEIDTIEGVAAHLEIFLSSPSHRNEYPWKSKFFVGTEPVELGQVNRFSERAQRIIRSQAYLAMRQYLEALNLPPIEK